ncbi:MAG: metallophosphoesterase [Chloroflexota bacterium]
MLSILSRNKLQVREEAFQFGTGLRLLYISDLHLTRWVPHIVDQLLDVCRRSCPDLILLGGDLLDLANGSELLAFFIHMCGCSVWAIAGNHDRFVGVEVVRGCVESAGGHWLEGEIELHPRLSLSGVCHPSQAERSILCAHDPALFPKAVKAGFDLTLAGHLHGGQCIFYERNGKLYPGTLLHQWTGDRFTYSGSNLLVSKGVHDTLPLRWNCPREVLLCCC